MNKSFLDRAAEYARENSGCRKVQVGCVITQYHRYDEEKEIILAYGTNRAVPNICKDKGCFREEKYGNNDKTHRNPDDCRAVHSEIDAICNVVSFRKMLSNEDYLLIAYITRYPCEACARALCLAGIYRVVYGRQQEISYMTKQIFDGYDVSVVWEKGWVDKDVTN